MTLRTISFSLMGELVVLRAPCAIDTAEAKCDARGVSGARVTAIHLPEHVEVAVQSSNRVWLG